ncbi:MAG TPA: pirin family protein [Dongiaceae bacterium]|jgi:hypothetical protein|nr:pirin family protein [Dongiaceae bacterium]
MIRHRPSVKRGRTRLDWLDSYHSFSFGDFFDPHAMGFRSLRVINEDRIAPGSGFPTHGHKDMEILTYVIEGSLSHKDSLGNGSTIRPGEVQIMSAGTGILHSEFSAPDVMTHLLQIWLLPERAGLTPRYAQEAYSATPNALVPLCARDPGAAPVMILQDATISLGEWMPDHVEAFSFPASRHAYVQLIAGVLEVNGIRLEPGDAAEISSESQLKLATRDMAAKFLFFDLA